MKENTLITISRQYGSGGKEIAEIIAKKMNVRYYDRQIVYLAAEKVGNCDMSLETILEESYKTPNRILALGSDLSIGLGMSPIPSYNKMYWEQARIIREIASKGSAVFLGRCADAVLEGYENCYHFFIYADDTFREKRAKEYYSNQTLKEIEHENKVREQYYNYYSGKKWGASENYDLMLCTSRIGIKKAADLILQYVQGVQEENSAPI